MVLPSDGSPCSCLQLSTLLDNANLALADLAEQPYESDTSLAQPLVRAPRWHGGWRVPARACVSGSRRRHVVCWLWACRAPRAWVEREPRQRGPTRALWQRRDGSFQQLAAVWLAASRFRQLTPALTTLPIRPRPPQDACIACLDAINTASTLAVSGAASRRRQLLGLMAARQARGLSAPRARRVLLTTISTASTADTSTCPAANIESQIAPSYVPAALVTPTANDDYYGCPFGRTCVVTAANGVLVNDTTPSTSGVAWVAKAVLTPPAHGNVTLYPNGSFIYTPQT